MNPYTDFVSGYEKMMAEGQALFLGGIEPAPRPKIAPDAPKALFFAPHPDDETIGGALALRLLREAKWNVIDVPVTLGSLSTRKAERLEELKGACRYLGIGLAPLAPMGLDKVTITTRAKNPSDWALMIEAVAKILLEHKPRVIFFPHAKDWNGTHIGVHYLVMDALRASPGLPCHLIETEFWGQMMTPNLLVESAGADLADLIAATSFHVGEVRRNPYHLLLPAWMQDNARRGSELVGGQGKPAAEFLFAQVLRLRKWNGSRVVPSFSGGRFLPTSENPAGLFE